MVICPTFGKIDGMENTEFNLPETNSSHLKMDGWNTNFSLWDGLVSGAMLVSGRVLFLQQSWKWKMGSWKMCLVSGLFSTSMIMGGRVNLSTSVAFCSTVLYHRKVAGVSTAFCVQYQRENVGTSGRVP